jgi:hypothetical protein
LEVLKGGGGREEVVFTFNFVDVVDALDYFGWKVSERKL